MRIDTARRQPPAYIVLDLESAVLDQTGHQRYVAMERLGRRNAGSLPASRRKIEAIETIRWPFQTVVTASAMVLNVHADGNLDVARFETFSAPQHTEQQVVAGLLQLLANAPSGAELAGWGMAMHDIPLIVCAAMKAGLTLPPAWRWMAFGGDGRQRHVDLARVLTGGFKIKPVHQAEYAAALDIPAKMTAAPFRVASLIYKGQWTAVQEVCEGDVLTGALLLARWRKLDDPRADIDVVEDRILRRVIELRAGRGYIPQLEARRKARFGGKLKAAANDARVLAPWLDQDVA